MKKYIVIVCVCISETQVVDIRLEIEADNLTDVYRKLSTVKFAGEVTKITVSKAK